MPKLTKRTAESAKARKKDYFIWDTELPGLGLRVYASGKRSYVIHYRFAGRSRRFTIGLHGFWTPELARQEARVLLGKIAGGEDPSEQRQINHKAITVKELCALSDNRPHRHWSNPRPHRPAGWDAAGEGPHQGGYQ